MASSSQFIPSNLGLPDCYHYDRRALGLVAEIDAVDSEDLHSMGSLAPTANFSPSWVVTVRSAQSSNIFKEFIVAAPQCIRRRLLTA